LHNVQTAKLKPATVFQYKVGTLDKRGKVTWSREQFEFHTARRGNTVNFVATADLGLVNAVAMPALQRLAKSHKYDFLTLSGDQVCSRPYGTFSKCILKSYSILFYQPDHQAYDMADFNGTKGDEYMRFTENLFANIPFMGAVGNHEDAYNFSHWKNR
jgi:acid phosphatase type 7